MLVFWILAIIVFLGLEVATVNMTSVWFAVGALAALAGAYFALGLGTQLLLFIVFSALSLWLFFRVFKPKLDRKAGAIVYTNADRIIGQVGRVLLPITPVELSGQIQVLGQVWSAVAQDEGAVFERDSAVRVVELRGVRAVVTAVEEGRS